MSEDTTSTRVCSYPPCNEHFTPKHFNKKYCDNPHYATCQTCGKLFEVPNNKISKNLKTCSSSCASSLSHTEQSKTIRQENSLKKYGTDFPTQDKEIKKKIKETIDNNPENDFRIGSPNFSKIIEEKYGVSNVSSLEEIKNKKTETSIKHFGTSNPFQNSEIQIKQQKTMENKYGDKKGNQLHIQNFSDYKTLKNWLVSFAENNGRKPTIIEASKYFNVTPSTISQQKKKHNLHSLFRIVNSKKEETFLEYLTQNFPNINYIHNDRSAISPYELDFYFPDHNFAVEISPTTTHHSSDKKLNYRMNSPKDRNYHLNKMLAAENSNIELLTIFDWMPWDKSMEMITHKLSGSSKKVYARKTTPLFIKKENNALSKKIKNFINDNHILGFNSRGTQFYTYLEYDGEIVAAAGWGTPRNLSIKKKNNKIDKSVIELTRMCFAKNYSVPGGASRLLKTFIKNYDEKLQKIITFSDCDLGTGKIYEKLGFSLVSKPAAQKNYVNPEAIILSNDDRVSSCFTIKGTSLHLAGADRLLKNFPGYEQVGMTCKCEDTLHPKAECLPSNIEIVEAYGFLPIYNCGYKKWELKVKEREF